MKQPYEIHSDHKPQSVQKEWLTYLTQEDIFFQRQRNNYLP